MQVKNIKVNTVIFGGGIAGLWLLHRLRKSGVDAVLLETNALGAGQTGLSQGIIHGGVKYALQGVLNRASQSIADMPRIWQESFEGYGEVNLSSARQLSDAQYLWSPKRLASRLTMFFASQVLRGRCEAVKKSDMPAPFSSDKFHGNLYRLSESVVDVYSVMESLAAPYHDYLLKINSDRLSIKVVQNKVQRIDYIYQDSLFHLSADNYVLAAGEHNEGIIAHTRILRSMMQRRPLRMTMLTFDEITPIYAHCMGKGSKPVLTITSHQTSEGQWVWYVGGDLAETGAKKTQEKHERHVMKALRKALPWLSFKNIKMKSVYVNRAEAWQRDGHRPDLPFVKKEDDMIVVWPTKLAFAPMVADLVMPLLDKSDTGQVEHPALADWPKAKVAEPVWNQLL